MNLLQVLQLGFMQRALLAGVIVAILCAIWGVFIVLRKQAYLSDAVAHASLTGIAIGILLGWSYLPLAILVGIIFAIAITYLKKHTSLADDTLIGILYTFLFAIGVILISLFPGYRPDLMSYLFGSLLSVTWNDILISSIALTISVGVVVFFYRKLVYVAFDPEAASIRGINANAFEYLINILISIATIIAIKSVGIVMVSALLLIPAASAKVLAKSFKQMFPVTIIVSTVSALSGIICSYYLNTPSGATIVVIATIIFFIVIAYKRIATKH